MEKDPDTARALPVPTGRYARMGRLGGMTAGIAGNMALSGIAQLSQGQRPSMRDLLLTPRNISRVADQLAKMRGAAMKIGQLMSMDGGEVLPPELAQIMARLRDDAHFMPPAQLKQVLNSEWPKGWIQSFKSFDVHPIAAASIGQVHRAKLRDGRDLAIKVQYPGVAKSIDADVANVGALMRMSGLLPKGFELGPYLEEAKQQLHEETDYIREAGQQVEFEALTAERSDFAVPEVYPDWSTSRILAMSFAEGVPIEDVAGMDADTRQRVATQLIELTLDELFVFRHMQTDPNFANYRYDPDSQRIVLLDFGAARELSPETVQAHHRLLRAGLADQPAQIEEVAIEIGFLAPDTPAEHRAQILEMIREVFKALDRSRPFDFADDPLTSEMQARGQRLAESGFVPPPLPIDVLLLQRKFGGVFLLCKRLGAEVDVFAQLDRYLNPAPG